MRSTPAIRESLNIRFADAADLDTVAALHQRTWQDAYRNVVSQERLNEGTLEYMRARWIPAFREHQPPARSILVAELDSHIAGVLKLWAHDTIAKRAELAWVHVAPERQRQGIGSAMLDEVLRLARSQGVDEISLWVVTAHDNASRFWKNRGWSSTGLVKTTTGEGWEFDEVELVMKI